MSNEPKAIYLLPTEGDGFGSFKIANSPSQISRPLITSYKKSQALRFRVSLVGVVHGTLSTGEPASLIVTEFRFESGDAAQRFRAATINYVFLPEDETSDGPGPEIYDIAPSGAWLMEPADTPSYTTVTSNSDDPPSSPVFEQPRMLARRDSIDSTTTTRHVTRVRWEFIQAYEPQGRSSLTGHTIRGGERGGKNIAIWNLRENPSTKSGIPTVLQTAVLLKRSSNANFVATLEIQAEVDLRYAMSEALKKIAGLMPRSNALHFKVDQQRLGNIGMIDDTSLDKVSLGQYINAVSTRR
ncbi:hypothetical protein G7Y89_g11136 [Cudoniella acicularis]|uniref:Uncharacterized protein n=1 Tax=Cudoniella acicularis TaxID=354080 RepID=A0A8H4RE81_9HELO|nr:hypothetical protein G7Y89_g11136 [Cudoniella acicularis]